MQMILCDSEELEKLTIIFRSTSFFFSTLIAKIANKLQRKLLALQKREWEFNLEEGIS